MLAMMKEDPKIQYQVELEISQTRGLGNKAFYMIQESAEPGLT